MRFLFVNTFYDGFLKSHFLNNDIKNCNYDIQLNDVMNQLFGDSNFYSENIKKLGHDALDIVFNCKQLQMTWMKEQFPKKISSDFSEWSNEYKCKVLFEQVNHYKPDILYLQDLSVIDAEYFPKIKKVVKFVIGQIASPIIDDSRFNLCDLIVSTAPHYVKMFRKKGINSEYLRLAFEDSILNRLNTSAKREYDCTFIGGISKLHLEGNRNLEFIAKNVNMDIWGYGREYLKSNSYSLKRHHGEAWGKDMYDIFLKSKISINRHGEIAQNYACNMRLYEATGCGSLLITDYKDNLNEMFEVGKEIEVYHNKEDLLEKILYYLEHDKERQQIALAGQSRTLREHNYYNRMQELLKILDRYY